MESDLQQQHHHHHQPPAANPGLTRFRSAPSSFFNNILESVLEREFCEDFLNRPPSPETGRILSRLMSGSMDAPAPPTPVPASQNPASFRKDSTPPRNEAAPAPRPPPASSIKSEPKVLQQNDFSSEPYYQSSPQPPLPNWSTIYEAVKPGRENHCSNLIRQSSSPAGLLSNINIDRDLKVMDIDFPMSESLTSHGPAPGYNTMRGTGGALGGGGGGAKIDNPLPPATRYANRRNTLARVSSAMVQMTPIAEVGDRGVGDSIEEMDPFGESNDFIVGLPVGSWEDSENYGSFKRSRGQDDKNSICLNGSEALNENGRGGRPQMLAHHLSLPKNSSEMFAIEKILEESVPCKIRAKRGCATHPRSIAERVRRTKISERMRKLQDLVPNMDKQTNTADMLDLAVDYIKELQQQVKMLMLDRAACTCSSRHQL
ncbi:hypothetical protein SAY86_008946 [Trapa natans]|uniref:BHLH domain-containing protein n=1 Tax=Trapa natans TaxID=22666 RepID=A0AAN7KEY2_TRANT|nr:hypothetical protein SAY86_008946 [Trapa natans]